MNKGINIAVIGNDTRLYYCAERLRSKGIRAVQYSDGSAPKDTEYYLFAPPLTTSMLLAAGSVKEGVTVFAGAVGTEEKQAVTSRGGRIIDYCENEHFASENACLTAEAAMTVYIGASASSFNRAKVLISGFGRIGKALTARLKAHGAYVTVSARKLTDIELIRAYGCTPMETAAISGEYDVIFNTVPARIFTRDTIDRTTTDHYIELASPPYGIETKKAWGGKTNVILASGLPGKVLPVSAGKLIAETVCTLLNDTGI